jgi:hypothetical protein
MPGSPMPMPREEPRDPSEAYRAGFTLGEWARQADGAIASFLYGIHDGVHATVRRSRRETAILVSIAVALAVIFFCAGWLARR